jgi:uncharacterized Zn finger protein
VNQERLNSIVQALTSRGVNKPCPRCGHLKFSVVGEAIIAINDDPSTVVVGGPAIPVVLVACDNCGYVSQHASIPLGVARRG